MAASFPTGIFSPVALPSGGDTNRGLGTTGPAEKVAALDAEVVAIEKYLGIGGGAAGVYNAQANGVTPGVGAGDQTAHLNALFAAVPSGSTVLIPPAIYMCNGLVISNPGITVTGPGATFRKNSDPGSTSLLTIAASNVTIDGITFDFNGSAYSSSGNSLGNIDSTSAAISGVTWQNCSFINGVNWGIYFWGDPNPITGVAIRNNYFGPLSLNGSAIEINADVSQSIVEGNVLVVGAGNDVIGISLAAYTGYSPPHSIKIISNSITMNGGGGSANSVGIATQVASGTALPSNIVIESNTVTAAGASTGMDAISVALTQSIIANNTYSCLGGATNWFGIELVGCDHSTISGNQIGLNGCGGQGIILNSSNDCTISANVITGQGPSAAGIALIPASAAGCSRNTISNNYVNFVACSAAWGYGIEIAPQGAYTADSNLIIGNTVVGLGSAAGYIGGVYINGTSGTITNTMVSNNMFDSLTKATQVYNDSSSAFMANRAINVGIICVGQGGTAGIIRDCNDWQYAAAAPSTATNTWFVGDKVWNTSVTASTTPGWVCTTAGTPGTWTAMPVL
jgi:parallel beta-helix repeat protein